MNPSFLSTILVTHVIRTTGLVSFSLEGPKSKEGNGTHWSLRLLCRTFI